MRKAIVLLGAVGFGLATGSASGQAPKGSPNPAICGADGVDLASRQVGAARRTRR